MSDKEKIFRGLLRTEWKSTPFSFEDWLLNASKTYLGKNEQEAESYTEANKKRLFNAIQAENDARVRMGLPSVIEVIDNKLLILSLKTPNNSGTKSHKQKVIFEVLKWIDGIHHREFEYAGALLSKFIGATNVEVTPAGNEGGVDFYALIPVAGPSSIMHGPTRQLRIVGQCKKYSSKLTVDKVREFTDVVESIRRESTTMAERIPKWFSESKGPISGWMISSSGYQEGSIKLCKQRGILLSDDYDIALNIVNSRKFPILNKYNDIKSILDKEISDLKSI